MLRAMIRACSFAATALLVLVSCAKESKPGKLKKMDFKVMVDERGRMLPEISLFDDKHDPFVLVGGSYTMTLSRLDGTVLCSTTRTLAKEDYDKKSLKTDWQDASCPPDPAADELRVTLEVKTSDKPDTVILSRDKTTPTKFIYRHLDAKPPVDTKKLPAEAPLPEPPPAAGSAGSAAPPAADTPAATSTDKPAAASTDKPAADKPPSK
jgi:hypothetical protein